MTRAGAAVVAAAVLSCAYVLRGVPWAMALSPAGPPSWAVDAGVLLRHGARLAYVAALAGLWAGVGNALLSRLRLTWKDRWEEWSLSFAVGAGAVGTALLLLGLAGLWHPALLAPAAGLGLWPLARLARAGRPAWPEEGWARAALLACAIAFAFLLPLALLPETFYDALNYHLAMPNLYLLRGRIGPTPENSYSGVPSIPMMLFGQALAGDSWGIAARLVHLGFLAAVLGALRGAAGRLGCARSAPAAAALFALSPVVMSEATRTSTGLEWTLFQVAAFHAFVAAAGERRGSPSRRGWLLVAGSALGFALATKYLAAAAALGLLAGAVWLAARREEGAEPLSAGEAALLFGSAGLWLSPWLVRNAVWYGNPVYPMFHSWFRSPGPWAPDWRRVSGGGLDPAFLLSPAYVKEWLLHPFLWSRSEAEFGGAFGPAFLTLAPLPFVGRLGPRGRLWAVLCAASWLPLSVVAHGVTRYMVPGLACAALLGAAALDGLLDPDRRAAALAALAAAALAGGAFCVMRQPLYGELGAVLGSVGPWDYLSHERLAAAHVTPPHAAFEWLEARAAPGERAVIVGDARHFPLRVDHLSSSEDQRSWLEVLADQSSDGADLARRLAGLRVRWVVMNRAEMARQEARLSVRRPAAAALRELWESRSRPVLTLDDAERSLIVQELEPPPSR